MIMSRDIEGPASAPQRLGSHELHHRFPASPYSGLMWLASETMTSDVP